MVYFEFYRNKIRHFEHFIFERKKYLDQTASIFVSTTENQLINNTMIYCERLVRKEIQVSEHKLIILIILYQLFQLYVTTS